mmetsp:Transcript_7945/g.14102  ORF Transcript_7945/g.14102 Transcript_7945/m.14102 type:complete len:116 (-) Transcript_7945:321-668(-)
MSGSYFLLDEVMQTDCNDVSLSPFPIIVSTKLSYCSSTNTLVLLMMNKTFLFTTAVVLMCFLPSLLSPLSKRKKECMRVYKYEMNPDDDINTMIPEPPLAFFQKENVAAKKMNAL